MDKIKPEWLRIHEAIHSGKTHATIHNVEFEVETAPTGLRQVRNYPDPVLGICLFIEQNKTKRSAYAQRAINGETLTWIIPRKGEWVLIDELVPKKEATDAA